VVPRQASAVRAQYGEAQVPPRTTGRAARPAWRPRALPRPGAVVLPGRPPPPAAHRLRRTQLAATPAPQLYLDLPQSRASRRDDPRARRAQVAEAALTDVRVEGSLLVSADCVVGALEAPAGPAPAGDLHVRCPDGRAAVWPAAVGGRAGAGAAAARPWRPGAPVGAGERLVFSDRCAPARRASALRSAPCAASRSAPDRASWLGGAGAPGERLSWQAHWCLAECTAFLQCESVPFRPALLSALRSSARLPSS